MTRSIALSATLFLLAACKPAASIQDDEPQVDPDVDGDTDPDTDEACVPSAEVCDGIDNDCDGDIDEDPYDAETFFADADGDGFGDAEVTIEACAAPWAFVDIAGDCDDSNADVRPDAVDTCDGIDNDCDPATGLATLVTGAEAIDLTDAFSAGSADAPSLVVLDQPGELAICEGTFFARLELQAPIGVTGVAGSEATILDAGASGTVVRLAREASGSRLSGLTLQNGLGEADATCKAGGICVDRASLAGEDLVVRLNASPGEGGGMAMLGGRAELSGVLFEDNTAASDGGALHVRPNGQLTLTDARLSNNTARRGGALFQLGGSSRTVMERVDVVGNQATGNGGGLVIDNGSLRMVASSLVDNASGSLGGGVSLEGVARSSVFEDVVFEGNVATRGGALFMRRDATVRDSQISGNEARNANSAAIQVDDGTLTLEATDFEDEAGVGNAPADIRAGADQLELGLDVGDVCSNLGCTSLQ